VPNPRSPERLIVAADPLVLAKALPGLELEYAECNKLLSDLETYAFNSMNGAVDEGSQWEHAWDMRVFEYHVKRLHLFIRMVLEGAGLSGELLRFEETWNGFSDIAETHWLHEVDALASDPLEHLKNAIDGIRILVGGGSPIQQADAKRLRSLLDATAYLVRNRTPSPSKENDIQVVMDDYLNACFMGDYVRKPQIPGFTKNFNADGGIKSLATAIEFKFVTNDTELKQAVSGIIEDTAGYKGSKDWTTFFSVIYQTEPFTTPTHFQAEMRRVDGFKWEPIVVVGGGGKSGKKIKPPKGAPPSAQL
jgi:hypothetical protein